LTASPLAAKFRLKRRTESRRKGNEHVRRLPGQSWLKVEILSNHGFIPRSIYGIGSFPREIFHSRCNPLFFQVPAAWPGLPFPTSLS